MSKKIVLNETSYFGWGARESLVEELADKKYKKALVVTDSNLMELGVAKKVINVLEKTRLSYEVYSDVKSNPTVSIVKKGLRLANKHHTDVIIAIGGGSVIDTAKAIGIAVTNQEIKEIRELTGVVETKNKSLPIIAFPTTAGRASETTYNYVIADDEKKEKLVCIDKHCIPMTAIVDTELMASMPSSIASATGVVALSQAIDCYLANDSWEMTEMYALKAMGLIYNNLERSISKDREAMEKMALAQYIAGVGFSNVSMGIINPMTRQLWVMYDTPHGMAKGMLLPYVLEYLGKNNTEKFRNMANAMGIDIKGYNDERVVKEVIKAIKDLTIRLNFPQHIRHVGGRKGDYTLLAENTFNDPYLLENQKEISLEDLTEIFKKAF